MTLDGKSALVTGGTRGLGKAIAFALARAGARVTVTHRWSSISEDDFAADVRTSGLPPISMRESDASDSDAVRALVRELHVAHGGLDVLVSNLALAKPTPELHDMKRSSFELTLRYTAWPIVELVQATHAITGRYPRYVIGVSSRGAHVCPQGYDFAGAAKAALESLCRYLALRLRDSGSTVNVLSAGYLDTASSRATFGDRAIEALHARGMIMRDSRAASVVVALVSGLMDSVTGQVITADEGWSLVDPISLIA